MTDFSTERGEPEPDIDLFGTDNTAYNGAVEITADETGAGANRVSDADDGHPLIASDEWGARTPSMILESAGGAALSSGVADGGPEGADDATPKRPPEHVSVHHLNTGDGGGKRHEGGEEPEVPAMPDAERPGLVVLAQELVLTDRVMEVGTPIAGSRPDVYVRAFGVEEEISYSGRGTGAVDPKALEVGIKRYKAQSGQVWCQDFNDQAQRLHLDGSQAELGSAEHARVASLVDELKRNEDVLGNLGGALLESVVRSDAVIEINRRVVDSHGTMFACQDNLGLQGAGAERRIRVQGENTLVGHLATRRS